MPASICRSVDALQPAEKSGSPACSPPARSPRRGACSSPSGVRLARGPKVGPWRGPLPRRRVTPPPILGDFLDKAMTPSGRSAASSPGVASPTLSASSSSLEVPALIDGAVVEASDAMKAVSPANRARDDCDDRGHAKEAKNRYGLGHLACRFQSLWAQHKPRVHSSSRSSSPAIVSPPSSLSQASDSTSPTPTPSIPPSSSSSSSPSSSTPSSSPPPRSFVSVLMAGQRPLQAGVQGPAARSSVPAAPVQQTAPPRPPPPSSAPGGGQQGDSCRRFQCRSGRPFRDRCSHSSCQGS
jgi:hypothetical protein